MSDDKMNVNIGLSVNTKGEELVDRLARKVKALEASLKSINAESVKAARAVKSLAPGSKISPATTTNQMGKASADKRSAADLYSFKSRLEAQRQKEAARSESYLHRLRMNSYRQAERDAAKSLKDRVAGEARVAREAKTAQAAAARAASADMRAIRERIQFQVRTSAQRVREQAATERARSAQAAAIVRDQRQAAREEAKSLRERMNFVSRMVSQRQREESASERDRQAAQRESIRLDRYRMGLRDREERRLHRESTARDNERDRLRGSALSNARSAVHHGSEGFNRTTRTIAGVGAVAGGVGALAARSGISARMETDTAETNLKIFSEQTQEQIREARRGWLDRAAIRNGLGVAGGLNAYGEVLKSGMKSPVENSKTIMGAVSALELDLRDTTKLAGLIDRNYGANSSPAKIKSALNAIAVAAREDPTQAPEIVEGMKRGFGVLSMGNMKPEELAALVSGGQSVGIQPGKAGTFIATLGKQLSSGANKFLDPKNRKELNFAASRMGFGNSREMARQFREDSTGTIMKVLESMKAMDPTQRTTVASALSGNQWNDEDLQIVNGLDGLKSTLKAVRDPSNSGFLDDAASKRHESWLGQWNSTKAIFNRFWESFGAGFDEMLVSVNSFFLDLHSKFDFDAVTNIVKQGLEGVKDALGVKSFAELFRNLFGGNLAGVGQEVRAFAKGFTSGVMDIVNGIKSFVSVFAGSKASSEEIGKWTGRIITFAAACIVAAPAVAVLSGLASGITALAVAAIGAWKILKAAGLVGGASAVAGTAGSAASSGASGAAAGAATGAGMLSKLLRVFGGAAINTVPAFTKEESDSLTMRLGKFAEERNKIREQGARDWIDPPAKSANENVRKPTEELKRAIEDNTLIHKQSFESQDNFSGLIRKASFTTSDTGRTIKASIQGNAGDLKAAVTSGSAGIVGNGPLSASRPGSALGSVGIGGRGIIGGGATRPGFGAGHGGYGSSMVGYGANPGAYKPLLDHIARSEGTAGAPGGGYNTLLAFGKFLPGGKEQTLTGKTLDEIDALQGGMLAHPQNGFNSSAIGRYQIVRKTLRGLRAKLGLKGSDKYDEAMQDRLGAELARQRGANGSLGQEWASLRGGKLSEAIGLASKIPSGASTTPGSRPAGADAGTSVAGDPSEVGKRIQSLKQAGAINGQECVALAKAYVGVSGSVTTWRKGAGAAEGTLKPGTPIATFLNRDGSQSDRYDGGGTGVRGNNTTHAGVFQEYIKDEAGKIIGMKVAEQFRGSGGPKIKDYIFGRGTGAKDGANYRAILGPDGQPLGGSNNPMSASAQASKGASGEGGYIRALDGTLKNFDGGLLNSNGEVAKKIGEPFQQIADKTKPNVEALTSKSWMEKIGRGIPLNQVFRQKEIGGFGPGAKADASMLVNPKFDNSGSGSSTGLGQSLGGNAPLGATAPINPGRAGQGGGSTTTNNSPVINVTGTGMDPNAIASVVQRKIQESMNRRTHDLDPGSISGVG